MDFGGYVPASIKMLNYNKGISGIIINSTKGKEIFDAISDNLNYEYSCFDQMKKVNQCLVEPFAEPEDKDKFWNDYEKRLRY